MKTLLSNELLENIGSQSGPHRELVTRRDIKKYAVAVGNLQSKYVEGDQAPPLFHIALFWDVVGLDALSTDGLSKDPLLPKFPLSRAMAGGSRIDYIRDIYPGDWKAEELYRVQLILRAKPNFQKFQVQLTYNLQDLIK